MHGGNSIFGGASVMDKSGVAIKAGDSVVCSGMFGNKTFPINRVDAVKKMVYSSSSSSSGYAATKCTKANPSAAVKDTKGRVLKVGDNVKCKGTFSSPTFKITKLDGTGGKVFNGSTSYVGATKCTYVDASQAVTNSAGKAIKAGDNVTCKGTFGSSSFPVLKVDGATRKVFKTSSSSFDSSKCTLSNASATIKNSAGKVMKVGDSVTCKGTFGSSSFKISKIDDKAMKVFNGNTSYVNTKCSLNDSGATVMNSKQAVVKVGDSVTCKGTFGSKIFAVTKIDKAANKIFDGNTGYVNTKCTKNDLSQPVMNSTGKTPISQGDNVTCSGLTGKKTFDVTKVDPAAKKVFTGTTSYASNKCTKNNAGAVADDAVGKPIRVGTPVTCQGTFGKASFSVTRIDAAAKKVYKGNTGYASTKCTIDDATASLPDSKGADMKVGDNVTCKGTFGSKTFAITKIDDPSSKVFNGNTSYVNTACTKNNIGDKGVSGVRSAIKIQIKPANLVAQKGKIEAAAGHKILGYTDKTGANPVQLGGDYVEEGGALSMMTTLSTYIVIFDGTVNPTTFNNVVAADKTLKSIMNVDKVLQKTVPASYDALLSGDGASGTKSAIKIQIKPANLTAQKAAIEAAAGHKLLGYTDKTGGNPVQLGGNFVGEGGALATMTTLSTYIVVFNGTVNPVSFASKVAASKVLKPLMNIDTKVVPVPASYDALLSGDGASGTKSAIKIQIKPANLTAQKAAIEAAAGHKLLGYTDKKGAKPVQLGGNFVEEGGALATLTTLSTYIVVFNGIVNPVSFASKVAASKVLKPLMNVDKVLQSSVPASFEALSAGPAANGPAANTSANGPAGNTSANGPAGNTSANGPAGNTSANGPAGNTSANGPAAEAAAEEAAAVEAAVEEAAAAPGAKPASVVAAASAAGASPAVVAAASAAAKKPGSTPQSVAAAIDKAQDAEAASSAANSSASTNSATCKLPSGKTFKMAKSQGEAWEPIEDSDEPVQITEDQAVASRAEGGAGAIDIAKIRQSSMNRSVWYTFTIKMGKWYGITATASDASSALTMMQGKLDKLTGVRVIKGIDHETIRTIEKSPLVEFTIEELQRTIDSLLASKKSNPAMASRIDEEVSQYRTAKAALQETLPAPAAAAAGGGGRSRKNRHRYLSKNKSKKRGHRRR
jgi:hypothetical protein